MGPPNHPLRRPYDRVLRCMGWMFDYSIFDEDVKPKPNPKVRKYPEMNKWYESENVRDLFFVGTLMHSKDFRKSSGGFIHGFRYLARALYHSLKLKYDDTPWPIATSHKHVTPDSLAKLMLNRTNEASGP